MMKIVYENNTVNAFSPEMECVDRVNLDEKFMIKTQDCYGGQVVDESVLRTDLDMTRFNQATGPIYVEDVTPGDWVRIDVIDITLDQRGVLLTSPGLGTLGEQITAPSTKFATVNVDENLVKLPGGFEVSLKPQIGVIGVATHSEVVGTESPGCHGGNLDTSILTSGASLLIRAAQPGLLLAIGDLHAKQGEGEMGGTGIEIQGSVTLKVSRVDYEGNLPAVITEQGLDILASDHSIDEAAVQAFSEGVDLFSKWHDVEWDIAYRVCSLVGDARISQMVNPLRTARLHLPKQYCAQNLW